MLYFFLNLVGYDLMLKFIKIFLILIIGAVGGFVGGWVASSDEYHINIQENNELTSHQFDTLEKQNVDRQKPIEQNDKIIGRATIQEKVVKKDSLKINNTDVVPQNDSTVDSARIKNSVGDKIKIKKEKLIDTRTIYVKKRDKLSTSKADSLLSKDLDIQFNNRSFYVVEFWEHPLGSRGYKMNGGKILLYGINPDLNIQLIGSQDRLILKYGTEKILLQDAEKFQKFTFVDNK